MNMNFLSPMMIENEEGSDLIFMNFYNSEVYKLIFHKNSSGDFEARLLKLDQNVTKSVFDDFENKRNDIMPEIPMEQISQVLNTEKDLSKQSENHIFRRNN